MARFITIALIALIALITLLLVGQSLRLFGLDPLGAAYESVFGRSPWTLLLTFFVLSVLFLSLTFRRWRRNPTRGFPWWDVIPHAVIWIIVVIVCVQYAGEFPPLTSQ